jgi:hypothetical protein
MIGKPGECKGVFGGYRQRLEAALAYPGHEFRGVGFKFSEPDLDDGLPERCLADIDGFSLTDHGAGSLGRVGGSLRATRDRHGYRAGFSCTGLEGIE